MNQPRSIAASRPPRRRPALLAPLLLLAAWLALPALAQPQMAQARLVSELSSIAPGQTFDVAMVIDMQPGWHVYWTNPGGPGFAPSMQWQLPDGFEAGAIQWPAPHHFTFAGITQYGYEDRAVLIIPVTAPGSIDPGSTVTLTANARWLVCKDACIPGRASLALTLPIAADPVVDPDQQSLFAEARKALPRPTTDPISVSFADGTFTLTVPGLQLPAGAAARLYPAAEGFFSSAAPQTIQSSDQSLTVLVPLAQAFAAQDHDGFQGVLRFEDASHQPIDALPPLSIRAAWADTPPLSADTQAEIEAAAGIETAAETETETGTVTATRTESGSANAAITASQPLAQIGFAFLGGMILNLMPCVFPVLSLKIMGFVQQAGGDRRVVRRHGYAFGVGVLISFWALTGLLLALQAGGSQLGWAFQFTSPGFVLTMLLLIFGLGLSMAGVFEIGTGMTRLGGQVDGKKDGYSKSFLSGVLATLIATPCVGPFMGPALGVALSGTVPQAMAIFTSLAVGMATPYVLLSIFPEALKKLPKPGPWMQTFKQLMAFPMFATAGWLMMVYASLTEVRVVMGLAIGMTVIAMGAWVYGKYTRPHLAAKTQRLGLAGALVLSVAGLWFILSETPSPEEIAAAEAAKAAQTDPNTFTPWQPFSDETVARAVSQNRPVLIDFTATWCLTCQVNKKTSLRTDSAKALYEANNVVTLEADYTRQPEHITKAIERHGRSGVPLYLVFSQNPEVTEPLILPNTLTPGIVQDAVAWAASGNPQPGS